MVNAEFPPWLQIPIQRKTINTTLHPLRTLGVLKSLNEKLMKEGMC